MMNSRSLLKPVIIFMYYLSIVATKNQIKDLIPPECMEINNATKYIDNLDTLCFLLN